MLKYIHIIFRYLLHIRKYDKSLDSVLLMYIANTEQLQLTEQKVQNIEESTLKPQTVSKLTIWTEEVSWSTAFAN